MDATLSSEFITERFALSITRRLFHFGDRGEKCLRYCNHENTPEAEIQVPLKVLLKRAVSCVPHPRDLWHPRRALYCPPTYPHQRHRTTGTLCPAWPYIEVLNHGTIPQP